MRQRRQLRCGCRVVMTPRSSRPATGREPPANSPPTLRENPLPCRQESWYTGDVEIRLLGPRPRSWATTASPSSSRATVSGRCSWRSRCARGRSCRPTSSFGSCGETTRRGRRSSRCRTGSGAPQGARLRRRRDALARVRARARAGRRRRPPLRAPRHGSPPRAGRRADGAARPGPRPLARPAARRADLRRARAGRDPAARGSPPLSPGEERLAAEVECGRHREVLRELEALAAREPAAGGASAVYACSRSTGAAAGRGVAAFRETRARSSTSSASSRGPSSASCTRGSSVTRWGSPRRKRGRCGEVGARSSGPCRAGGAGTRARRRRGARSRPGARLRPRRRSSAGTWRGSRNGSRCQRHGAAARRAARPLPRGGAAEPGAPVPRGAAALAPRARAAPAS